MGGSVTPSARALPSGRCRSWGRLLAAVVALAALAGCGASEATPTPAAEPTATPEPTPTFAPLFEADSETLALLLPSPTPTPEPVAVIGPVVYELDRISCNPEGAYELRMGETTAWGYAASDRVSGIEGDGVLVSVNVGDTLSFRRIENPARNCAVPLVVVNEDLGFDHTLQPDDRVEPFSIALTKAGTFDITDPAEAGGRGSFVIEVKAAAGAGPRVYELARISTPDCNYELRMGLTTAWGYNDPVDDSRINATVGDGILVTINVGDTLRFDRFETPSRLCTETVSIVNEELGLNETLQPDERIEPYEIVFPKAGSFVIDDPAKPGGRGTFVIEVKE